MVVWIRIPPPHQPGMYWLVQIPEVAPRLLATLMSVVESPLSSDQPEAVQDGV